MCTMGTRSQWKIFAYNFASKHQTNQSYIFLVGMVLIFEKWSIENCGKFYLIIQWLWRPRKPRVHLLFFQTLKNYNYYFSSLQIYADN